MLPTFFDQIYGQIILIIAIAIGIDLLLRLALSLARKQSWYVPWGRLIDVSIRTPAQWLIWGSALLISLELISIPLPWIHSFRVLFIIAIVTWILINSVSILEQYFWNWLEQSKERKFDKTLVITLSRLTNCLIIIIALIMVLDTFDVPLTAVLAFGGIGGIAISWAAKDVIANFFGGFMIFINRPFTEGDWIKSTNKNFEGYVEQIGWYMTRIRSLERRPTFVPNALITDAIIENPGRMYHRRISTPVTLRYQDFSKIDPILTQIQEMLQSHPHLDRKQIALANLTEFADDGIIVEVYCFTHRTSLAEFRETQQDILIRVAKIVENNGAEMAYPTRTLHVFQEEGNHS